MNVSLLSFPVIKILFLFLGVEGLQKRIVSESQISASMWRCRFLPEMCLFVMMAS